MKKLGVLLLVVVLSVSIVSTASALVSVDVSEEGVWEKYFPNNDTAESDIPEEEKEEEQEPEKDWLETDQRIFPPGWANETRHSNLPPGYFNVTLKEEFMSFPPGYWEVDWGIQL